MFYTLSWEHIFFSKLLWKMKIVQMKPIILKLFLKQELKIKKYISGMFKEYFTHI
jgi:hypothetical protein